MRGRGQRQPASEIDRAEPLIRVHILRRARRGVPAVGKLRLEIPAGETRRPRRNRNLIRNVWRGQPLDLGQYGIVDRARFQPSLPAQAVAELLVEIDVVIGIVEETALLIDPVAADTNRQYVVEFEVYRALCLFAACFEIIAGGEEARIGEFGTGRHDVDRASDRIAAVKRALCTAQHLDPTDIEQV